MEYRRFGKTGLRMPVFSCGGMRFQFSWNKDDKPDAASDENVRATVLRALDVGITHIETARGYGTSELQLGRVLPKLPRERFIFQTKVGPNADATEFRDQVLASRDLIGLDTWDLFAIHGINNQEKLEQVMRPGGCLEAALKLRDQGVFRHLGFSTHADCDFIIKVLETDAFDYVNLHWFWVMQEKFPAIQAAHERDMGVFIISPNDKGGQLYAPSDKLRRLCQPLHPMIFNALFCLSRPEVHTLSIGAANPGDFDLFETALAHWEEKKAVLPEVLARLEAEMDRVWGADFRRNWRVGVPAWEAVPGEVNIQLIIQLMLYVRALDMHEFGRARYGLLGNGGDWFPGQPAINLDLAAIGAALAAAPWRARLLDLLQEAHACLGGEETHRLSSTP